jgi:hypothetical protein
MPRVWGEESGWAHYQAVSVSIVALYLQFHDAFTVWLVGTGQLTEAPRIRRAPNASLRGGVYCEHQYSDER